MPKQLLYLTKTIFLHHLSIYSWLPDKPHEACTFKTTKLSSSRWKLNFCAAVQVKTKHFLWSSVNGQRLRFLCHLYPKTNSSLSLVKDICQCLWQDSSYPHMCWVTKVTDQLKSLRQLEKSGAAAADFQQHYNNRTSRNNFRIWQKNITG